MSEKESSKVTAVELRRVLKGTCPLEMTQAVVGDFLAEVAKGECQSPVGISPVSGEPLPDFLQTPNVADFAPTVPCGHCIVCVSREVVKG